ncbi:helix-turn-helix domain-containing protein [Paenochrobactrum glaciei]|uniref:Helix-turn-helix domain-containing protein n=1 Tax=Paenochrobactrum glaciei TaxID=486407 RepID=A0ABN1GQ81_9HYPH
MENEHAFVGVRFQLLELLCRDRALGDREVRIASFLISTRFNRYTGVAWTSFTDLAEVIGCSKKTVQRALQILEAQNWFMITRGNGRGNGTCIELCAERITMAKPAQKKEANIVSLYPRKGNHSCPVKRSDLSEKGRQIRPTYQEKKYQNTRVYARPVEQPQRLPDIFVPVDSDYQIGPWREWLNKHALPSLDQCGRLGKYHGRFGYLLPSRYPPETLDKQTVKAITEHLLIRAEQSVTNKVRQA